MEALGEDADRTSRPSPATSQDALAGDDLSPLIDDVARSLGVARRELTGGGRARRVVRARAALAYRAHVERRIPVAHLVAALGLTEATVRRAIDAQRARLANAGIAAREGASLSPTDRNAGTSPNEPSDRQ
jgi:hypothetical protein